MSQADVDRFIADLKSNEGLRSELSGHASGVGSVVAFAKGKGYDVSADEATAYIHSQAGRELNDAELDAVAGGKGGNISNQSATTLVTQVAEAVTSVATTTSVAAEVEVVAVIVLT